MRYKAIIKSVIGVVGFTSEAAFAHVSQQGIVLLLPTDVYVVTGCLAVIVSIFALTLFPPESTHKLYKPLQIQLPAPYRLIQNEKIKILTSVASLCLLVALIVLGVVGTRDPLANLLPLTIWTVWWIAIVLVHIVVGDLWQWINPWTGLYKLVHAKRRSVKDTRLPACVGCWPACLLYLLFYGFLIADWAPDDPARLANVVLGYVLFTFAGLFILGEQVWLRHFECFSILCRFLAQIAPIRVDPQGNGWTIGLPGWKAIQEQSLSISQAVFLMIVLASGSFDGLNETFWWLGQIGINPLAFPGRSAVTWWSIAGLLLSNALLVLVFSLSVWLGVQLANRFGTLNEGSRPGFKQAFCTLSISVLPIAAAYHGSHYLISFLINGQYFIAALTDPLAVGSNLLGLKNYQVTTGFLNTIDSVKQIWFSQAGLIVAGHILAVLMAHLGIAKLYRHRVQSLMFHLPLALFMAAYTWFGLWLLAAPRGA